MASGFELSGIPEPRKAALGTPKPLYCTTTVLPEHRRPSQTEAS